MDKGEDRRRFTRYLFSDKDKLTVFFKNEDNEGKPINATLLNLSEGGMCLNFSKGADKNHLREGNRLLIDKIGHEKGFNYLVGNQVVIKWALPYKPSRGLRAGCEFVDLESEKTGRLRKFIQDAIGSKMKDGR